MRAIVVTRFGGPEVLEVREESVPAPGAGQLLVDAEAIGVNYRDIYEREGTYGGTPPLVAGVEGAGTVAAVGPGVTEVSVGDRVAWSAAPGSYAQQVLVDVDRTVPVPEGMSTEVAAAAVLQGMTAHYLATSTYPVQDGEAVIVHAAAGGVGMLLTQIVKMRGGRVIGTTSSEEKAELARGAGADEVVPYDSFEDRARELTGGEGVAAVYDGIGRATFDQSLAALRPRGYLVVYGAASGPPPRSTSRASTRARSSSPARRSSTTAQLALSCCSGPRTCSAGSRPASSRCGSGADTHWRTHARPRRTSLGEPPRAS